MTFINTTRSKSLLSNMCFMHRRTVNFIISVFEVLVHIKQCLSIYFLENINNIEINPLFHGRAILWLKALKVLLYNSFVELAEITF